MASLPGMPGSLGLSAGSGFQQPSGTPTGSDLSLDLPPGIGESTVAGIAIVNKTVFHWPTAFNDEQPDTSVPIPPTTAGNTLVIVQNSLWYPRYPVFNGVWARWVTQPTGSGQVVPPNTIDNGFFGGSADTIPQLENAGALIAYFTNIADGVPEIVFKSGGAPEWTVIYELSPCFMYDGNPVSGFVSEPSIVGYPVNGPLDVDAIYFAGITASNFSEGSFFDRVNPPWNIDEQDLFDDKGGFFGATHGCAAVAIAGGRGFQQPSWIGGSADDYFATTAISLVRGPGGGGGTPTPSPDLDQFLPNVWIVS